MKKTICIIITTCLIICSGSFAHEPIHAYAGSVTATYTAVEALQVLLAALGIKTATQIASDDVSFYNLIVDTLNKYKNGLGNDVANSIVKSKGTLELTKTLTDNLMRWRDETYTESGSYSKTFDITATQEIHSLDDVKNLVPVIKDFQIRYNGSASEADTYFKTFLNQCSQKGYKYISIIHCVKYYKSLFPQYYHNVFIVGSKVSTPFHYEGGYYSHFSNGEMAYYLELTGTNGDGTTYIPMQGIQEDKKVGLYVGSDLYSTDYPMVANQSVVPISTSIAPAAKELIKAGVYVPITKSSVLSNDEVIGNTTITIPANVGTVLDGVRDDTLPFPDALLDFGVIAVDKTDTVAVEKAIADVKAGTGDIENYKVNLVDFFPFCLPFDFYRCIALLNAEPQAPEFDFSLPVGYKDGEVIWENYHISLDIFNPVAEVVRKFETLAFMLGLIILTRDKFIRS